MLLEDNPLKAKPRRKKRSNGPRENEEYLVEMETKFLPYSSQKKQAELAEKERQKEANRMSGMDLDLERPSQELLEEADDDLADRKEDEKSEDATTNEPDPIVVD